MNKQLVAVKAALFSFYALQAVLLPYLPIYFEMKGYTPFQIGWLMNVGPFVAMFAQPVWGYLSDKTNTIKRIVALLWLLTIASSVGLFLSGTFGVAFWFVMLLYFFMYPSIPLLDSLTMKSIQGTGRSYGSVRTWGSAGFTAVALLSGYMLAWIGGIERMGTLFWSLWIVPFAALTMLRDEPSKGTGSGAAPVNVRDIGTLFRSGTFLWFLAMVMLVSIPHRMNDVLFTLHLSDLGAPSAWFGLAWAIASLSEIPAFALLGRKLYKYHELAVLALTALLYAVRWLAYAWIDDPAVLIALQASHSITYALFWMATIQYVVRLVPEEMGSTGQAIISAVFLGLAGLIGGIAGGWLNQEWGGAGMYAFGAALSAAAAVLLLVTRQYRRKRGLD
ncbi:MFS transporter [Paenibacillus flagellatus]|uniref:MFS transporter n=1 Tax=Paenibacillus flagellatus TaxID=2211139 RepID=A0A2V5KML1_9BACL|nr:MFS transporter [Paenibacillus flagellatus]PYI56430.1 MFS transporter [Paenibacillus flagellatus]